MQSCCTSSSRSSVAAAPDGDMSEGAVADDWGQSISDPFGSAAVEILNSLTPSPPKLSPSSPSTSSHASTPLPHSLRPLHPNGDPFLNRLDVATQLNFPLSPSPSSFTSTSASSSSSASTATPRSTARPTIYDEEDDVRSSQEEAAASPTSTPTLRSIQPPRSTPATTRFSSFPFRPPTPSTSSPPPTSFRPPAPLLQPARPLRRLPTPSRPPILTPSASPARGRSAKEDLRREEERKALDFPDPYAGQEDGGSAGVGVSFGFTSGNGRRVEVSAASLALGQQLMKEVEEEFTHSRPVDDDPDAPLLSVKSAGKPRFQPPPAAAKAGSVGRVAAALPPFAFKTPARIPRPPPAGPTPSRPALGTFADSPPLTTGGFTTGGGRALPPASEASLAKARALIASAAAEADALGEAEMAGEQKVAEASTSSTEREGEGGVGAVPGEEVKAFEGFSTGRGMKVAISEDSMRWSRQLFQEVDEETQQRASVGAAADDEADLALLPFHSARKATTSAPTRPPPSSFKPPARLLLRADKPASTSLSAEAPVHVQPSHASPAQPPEGLPTAASARAKKSASFDVFLSGLGDADGHGGEDPMLDDESLLPPPLVAVDGHSGFTAANVAMEGAREGETAATFVRESEEEEFPSFSSSSSSPSGSSPITPPNGALPSDVMGGFVTGGGRQVAVRPESWAKALQFMQRVDSEDKTGKGDDASTAEPQLLASRRPLAPLSSNSTPQRPPPTDDAPLLFQPPRGKENTPLPPHVQRDKTAQLHTPRPPPFSAPKPAPRPFRPPMANPRPAPTDSPLPSPGPVLSSHRSADRRPPVDEEDASHKKKRRLAFHTPRPHVTGRTTARRGPAEDGADEPDLLRSSKKAAALASAVRIEMKKHAQLSEPLLPLPSLEPPPSTFPFSCTQHPIERLTESELFRMGLSDEVIHMTATSALSYRFTVPTPSGGECSLGAEHVYHHLIQQGCDPSLFSLLWVRNHYRWIVWKLAALERRFPSHLANRCLTYHQLMKQIQRRYHSELEQVHRSALTLILERDESAARYLVLCIAAILSPPDAAGEGEEGVNPDDDDPDTAMLLHSAFRSSCHLVLTDGHYSIPAKLDPPMLALLHRRRLHVGSTLRIFNAALAGGTDAVTPLENDAVHLTLHANSTRRAPRGCRLGLQASATFSVSLRGVVEGGGGLPCVCAVVGRVYPMTFLEMMEDGRKMHRTQRAEDRAQEEWKERMEKRMEEQRLQWEARMDKHAAARSQLTPTPSSSSSSFVPLSSLDSDSIFRDEQQAMGIEVEQPQPRTVIPYLKVRLHELVPPGAAPPMPALEREDEEVKGEERAAGAGLLSGCECLFTVWRPEEGVLELLTEGTAVAIYGATVSGRFDGCLRLGTQRSTPIVRMASIPAFTSLRPRALPFHQLQSMLAGAEFDVVCLLVYESRECSSASLTTTRHLYGVYDSEDVLMVEVTESSQLQLLPSIPLQLPLVALLTALKYAHYDRARRVHVAHAGKETAVRLRGGGEGGGEGRKALAAAWGECREWFDTKGGEEVRKMQTERVRCLVEDVDNGGSDMESEAWYEQLGSRIQATEAERAQRALQPKVSQPQAKHRLALPVPQRHPK